jgi:hypothetical protein
MEDREMRAKFLSGNMKEGDHFEDSGIGGTIILTWKSRKQGAKMWIGFIWLKIGTGCGLLSTVMSLVLECLGQ